MDLDQGPFERALREAILENHGNKQLRFSPTGFLTSEQKGCTYVDTLSLVITVLLMFCTACSLVEL